MKKETNFNDFIEKICKFVSIISMVSLMVWLVFMAFAIFVDDLEYLNKTAVPFWFITMGGVAIIGILMFAGEAFFSLKTILFRFVYAIGMTIFLICPLLNMNGIEFGGWGQLILVSILYMCIPLIPRHIIPEFRNVSTAC